jgi:tetratricopeptide (TPR) repeat protein
VENSKRSGAGKMGGMGFPSIGRGYRAGVFSVVLVLGSAGAWGDTIVLKNGHRISASNVVELGDKIRYETNVGELSLPKSIVDHIEKGSYVSNMAITPPAMDEVAGGNGGEIERAVIHGGAIDREYIAKLESETRSGSAAARMDAAVAHHAAASFELAHGDMDHALADGRTAVMYAPEEPLLLMDVAYLHLRRSEYRQSLDYLERAQRIAPSNPDVAKLSGWAYYGMNKLPQAVEEWKRALALRPDAEVQAALEKAERDKGEEEGYKENESAHFTLRYSGSAEPALAREVLRTLETHYARINSELNCAPPDSIGVILYTQQAFADVTRAPGWADALNDGRLRVPVQGLSSMTDELSRLLKHELTHSFVQQKTHGRAPTWIQEGLAQWMEGKRSGEHAEALLEVYGDGHAISLGNLEGSWMGFQSDEAVYAYAWALANIEYIVQADGMGDVERILERIGVGSSTESALHDVLHSDYGDVMRSSADYLRRTYSR